MKDRYRVLVVGAGKPGHAAAVCDIDEARLDAAAEKLRVTLKRARICPLRLASSDICEAVASSWSVDFARGPDEGKWRRHLNHADRAAGGAELSILVFNAGLSFRPAAGKGRVQTHLSSILRGGMALVATLAAL